MKNWICLFLSLLLLTGCAVHGQDPTVNLNGTVGDIFTVPNSTQADPDAPTVPTDITPTDAPEPTNPPSVGLGSMNFGPTSPSEGDERGRYRVYEGGQINLPFSIKATGTISTYDIGILLFVDGVAQPYRVGPEGEYAYLHTFSQKDGALVLGQIVTTADLYFTPITGKAGDMLEIYAVAMLNPNYVPSQGSLPFANTGGAIEWEGRLRYDATPPEDAYPEKAARLLQVSTSVVDCTALDVKDWTEVDMITATRMDFTVNSETVYVYDVTEDTPVKLRFAVWGSPYVHYGLVFFVDNVPVYTADLSDIWVTVQMGQKTIIEATLDMTGFTGEGVVYAMLVPRNYYTSEIETRAYFTASTTIYLLAKGKDA